jgi:RNA polymerase sigma-70 factor (ECF subfamily)
MAENSESKPNAELLERLLAQDRDRLISIADRFVRDRHEAEDIVQETVTAVWQRLSEIGPDKLANYLARAVRQNALKRKQRKRELVILDNMDATEPSTRLEARIVDPLDLEHAISTLPLLQQNVIRMKYYFGMSFRQIGSALSISTDTAASRCRYALAKLQKVLKREGDET